MIVVTVYKRDTHILFGKFLRKTHTAESGADNDNVFLICHIFPLLVFNSEKNHIVGSFSPFEKA